MDWKKAGCLCALLVFWITGTAFAEEGVAPRPWGSVSSTFGPCGMGFPQYKLAVGGNLVYGTSDNVRRHSEKGSSDTKVTQFSQALKFRYGILPGLDVRTATPFYSIHIDNSNKADRTNYGMGDTAVVFHQVLLNQGAGSAFNLAVDLGGVVPTASVGEHSVNGIGNDAWGAIAGIGATYFLGSNRFDTEVNVATFTEGAKEYQKGDRFRWNLGYAYAINELWDIGAESTYERNDETELRGQRQNDASEEWYVGPKVMFKYSPWNTNVGVIAKFPVQRWYQNTKAGSDDVRFEFKLIKTF